MRKLLRLLEDLSSLLTELPASNAEDQARAVMFGLDDGSVTIAEARSWLASVGWDRGPNVLELERRVGSVSTNYIGLRV